MALANTFFITKTKLKKYGHCNIKTIQNNINLFHLTVKSCEWYLFICGIEEISHCFHNGCMGQGRLINCQCEDSFPLKKKNLKKSLATDF